MNSLTFEILKLFVSSLAPISVVITGLFINKRLKVFEHKQWKNQKLIEKRLEIYSEIAPLYNDLLCYYTFVGNWKDLSPDNIVKYKRIIDKKINLAVPLFSEEFVIECNKFIELCYKLYNGWGEDAKLRTTIKHRKESYSENWNKNWDAIFCNDKDCTNIGDIRKAYLNIMKVFSKEIGLQ